MNAAQALLNLLSVIIGMTSQALRQRFPGRPPSKESHPGFLGVLKDATSAICCGGIAGMVRIADGTQVPM